MCIQALYFETSMLKSIRVSNELCIEPSVIAASRINSSPEPLRYSMKTKELSTDAQIRTLNYSRSSIKSIIRE